MNSQRDPDETIAWIGRYILPLEPRLRAWLRSAFRSIEVDDVVQEAYCRISSSGDLDRIEHPQQYLFRVARNIVLEQIRRSRVVSIETVSGFAELENSIPDELSAPDRILEGRRTLARVEELIAALPERAGRVFRLRKVEGLTQRQIAQQLGITETMVENDVARGLRRILTEMTEEERAELPLRGSRDRWHDRQARIRD